MGFEDQLLKYYNEMADAYLALNEPDTAAEWYQRVATYERENYSPRGQMYAQFKLAKALIQSGNLPQALLAIQTSRATGKCT